MSENNQENKSEIMQSEIIEDIKTNDDLSTPETVVIKKGGFISFSTFILAACSLTISAYLFMQLKNQNPQPSNKAWQEIVAKAEKNSDEKFNQLSNQIKQIQNTNTELQTQLKSIQTLAANIQSSDNNSGEIKAYDDSQLIDQIQALKTQLTNQNTSLNQIQNTVTKNNQKQDQAIQNLSQKVNKPEPEPNNLTLINRNYKYELAESFLQAAHKNLNIDNNIEKGQEFLNKTLEQMAVLEGASYQELANDIRQVYNGLLKISPIDLAAVNNKIDDLKNSTANLAFKQSIDNGSKNIDDQKESSWYDKLIVIRKVDDQNNAALITGNEQQKVLQNISHHYDLIKAALMSENHALWMQEISTIEVLLNEHFSAQSDLIKSQLAELQSLDISPKLPDLTRYLEALHALNKQELFESENIPFESKIISKSSQEKNENN